MFLSREYLDAHPDDQSILTDDPLDIMPVYALISRRIPPPPTCLDRPEPRIDPMEVSSYVATMISIASRLAYDGTTMTCVLPGYTYEMTDDDILREVEGWVRVALSIDSPLIHDLERVLHLVQEAKEPEPRRDGGYYTKRFTVLDELRRQFM
jgi:hypothetical protein